MPPMFHRRVIMTFFLLGAGLASQAYSVQGGLTPVATNVWSAPSRQLAPTGVKTVRKSWIKNPMIPYKKSGFIPLKPAGNKNGPVSVLNGGNRSAVRGLTNGTPMPQVGGSQSIPGHAATVLGPRSQPLSSLYRDPSP